ncbi:MAG: AI-2E family transporter [Anaerolineaceae bacterium]
MNEPVDQNSPNWTNTTKLVVALVFIAVLAGVVIQFKTILGPLMISFMLAYILNPIACFLKDKIRISWNISVGIIYLLLLILLLGSLTLGGLAIFGQLTSLIKFIQSEIVNVPKFLADLSTQKYLIGPFTIDFSQLDLVQIGNQILSMVQPIISSFGTLVGSFAAGTASTIGWIFFAILISYFILSETKGVSGEILKLSIPGYEVDIKNMGIELNRVWNAFFRGQLIIILLTIILYTILLGSLQVSFYLGLALVAGLARFVPYVGPVVAWTTYGLVALFQDTTLFGLQNFPYALIVVGVAWVTDVILDNLLVPRLMGNTLKVHPAAVMIAAIVFGTFFGIIGVILAAPVLATSKLFGQYVFHKMFDAYPWEELENRVPREPNPPALMKGIIRGAKIIQNAILKPFQEKLINIFHNSKMK